MAVMTNWLERARRELAHKKDNGLPLTQKILPDVGNRTAVTAERSPTAVLAVPQLSKSGISGGSIGSNGSAPNRDFQENAPLIPLTPEEEGVVRIWLAQIGESDVGLVLDNCRNDPEHKPYCLVRSTENESNYKEG